MSGRAERVALLAHTGVSCPRRARGDLLGHIFTRIGASDDLARGQSTFMVTMGETTNVLNDATPQMDLFASAVTPTT